MNDVEYGLEFEINFTKVCVKNYMSHQSYLHVELRNSRLN